MKKIVITILVLLLVPVLVLAVDDLSFDADTTISLSGSSIDLTVISGSIVDQMVVNSTDVQFVLSDNSHIVLRSSDKYELTNTYNGNSVGYTCESSYSEIDLYGPSSGTKTLTVTPSTTICTAPTTTSSGGSGDYVATEEEVAVEEEEVEEVTIQDGDLIRNPNAEGMAQFDIYIVKVVGTKKFKRLILSPHVFESYEHLSWDDVKDVSQSVIDEYTTSDLVRAEGDYKVYKLIADGDTGTKQWLNITAEEFVNQGYDWDAIYIINATDRDAYSVGAEITGVGATEATAETIIIKVSALRVRSLPSLEGEILTLVHQGEVYQLLDEQDGWYKITTQDGITGWCFGGETGGYAVKQ
jgi:uncharacterized protein YxeA